MFVRGAPAGLENYLKRFLLSMGYSANIFAANRRANANIASARGPGSLMELAPVGALFSGRYCENEQTLSWETKSVQAIIYSKLTDEDEDDGNSSEHGASGSAKAPSDHKKSAKVKKSTTGSLLQIPKRDKDSIPTIEFLSDLANALHAETFEFSIDYLLLHRSCWRLLRQMNEACKPKLLDLYGPGYLEKEHQLPLVIGYLFMTATTTSRVADVLLPRRGDIVASSKLLATAASCTKDMIDSRTGSTEMQMLEELLGCELEMDELDPGDALRA